MCPGKVHVVREKLQQVQSFLEPLKPLANAHMTSFITQNCWEMLPEDIKTEVILLSSHDMYKIFWSWGSNPSVFCQETALGKFLSDCWHFSLASEYFNELMLSCENSQKFSERPIKCMSPKKSHEVSTLKEIVAYLYKNTLSNCVVDVGGGKGYFGASLVLEKKIKVISIDSKSVNTRGAVHIFGRIEKHQHAEGNPGLLYKQVTAYVTPETNLKALAEENFGSALEHKICLTGLHVCGNLASTCIELFCKNDNVQSVCSIGCCYNLLTEKFETGLNADADLGFGFPLSEFLKKLKYCLGRNARMIACQPIDRICLEKRVMKPSLFWRAAIQVYFERQFGPECGLSVGRRCSKATNFTGYCQKVQQCLDNKLELTEEKINKLATETEKYFDNMVKFYCFRLALAPVVETLIVLDRLLYLLEQDMENAYICKAFDGATSPRCHAVIAMKTLKM